MKRELEFKEARRINVGAIKDLKHHQTASSDVFKYKNYLEQDEALAVYER